MAVLPGANVGLEGTGQILHVSTLSLASASVSSTLLSLPLHSSWLFLRSSCLSTPRLLLFLPSFLSFSSPEVHFRAQRNSWAYKGITLKVELHACTILSPKLPGLLLLSTGTFKRHMNYMKKYICQPLNIFKIVFKWKHLTRNHIILKFWEF